MNRLKPANFIALTAAGIINAAGIVIFLLPMHLFDSGLSGTAMLASYLIPGIPSLSLFIIVLNIPFFIIGFRKQGLSFTVYSVFAVAVYSLTAYILTEVARIDISVESPVAGTDILLCAIFGGLVSGAGSGITLRFGGAMDGVEVLAVIFAERIGITVGTFVFIYNIILYCAAGIILGSWFLPLYSVITYFIALKTIDFIVEGLDKGKSAMIITVKPDEISEKLSETFGYGITHIDAKGFYKDSECTIIYFVVNRFEIGKLKSLVRETDPHAFITISDVSDIMGSHIKKTLPGA